MYSGTSGKRLRKSVLKSAPEGKNRKKWRENSVRTKNPPVGGESVPCTWEGGKSYRCYEGREEEGQKCKISCTYTFLKVIIFRYEIILQYSILDVFQTKVLAGS